MEENENTDKLKQSIKICLLHMERMTYAKNEMAPFFPLDTSNYTKLDNKEFSLLDQFIFRFSKLQDSMGNKLFPVLLENLGEDITSKPFIDLLLLLEKLGIIGNHNEWLTLRETRDIITHEYPFVEDEVIEGLNILNEDSTVLIKIWRRVYNFITKRYPDLAE